MMSGLLVIEKGGHRLQTMQPGLSVTDMQQRGTIKKYGLWAVSMEVPSTFAIQTKTMLPAGHKPALQELCSWYVAVTRLQCLTANYGLLAKMEAAEHLTHGTKVIAVPVQKSWLKTMKLQEVEYKVE